jgi:hypothetical protein
MLAKQEWSGWVLGLLCSIWSPEPGGRLIHARLQRAHEAPSEGGIHIHIDGGESGQCVASFALAVERRRSVTGTAMVVELKAGRSSADQDDLIG